MVLHVIIALPVPLDITKRNKVVTGKEISVVRQVVHTVTMFWENTVFPVILHAESVTDLQKIIANLANIQKS